MQQITKIVILPYCLINIDDIYNNSFTISEIYHKGYHIYTRVLYYLRDQYWARKSIRQQQQQEHLYNIWSYIKVIYQYICQ